MALTSMDVQLHVIFHSYTLRHLTIEIAAPARGLPLLAEGLQDLCHRSGLSISRALTTSGEPGVARIELVMLVVTSAQKLEGIESHPPVLLPGTASPQKGSKR